MYSFHKSILRLKIEKRVQIIAHLWMWSVIRDKELRKLNMLCGLRRHETVWPIAAEVGFVATEWGYDNI